MIYWNTVPQHHPALYSFNSPSPHHADVAVFPSGRNSGETEIFYPAAWPLVTLMTGIIALRSDTFPDLASLAITTELLRWIGLHAAKTFGLLWSCSVEIAHYRPELFILIPCGNVNSTWLFPPNKMDDLGHERPPGREWARASCKPNTFGRTR